MELRRSVQESRSRLQLQQLDWLLAIQASLVAVVLNTYQTQAVTVETAAVFRKLNKYIQYSKFVLGKKLLVYFTTNLLLMSGSEQPTELSTSQEPQKFKLHYVLYVAYGEIGHFCVL